uniref:Protein CASC3 n=1 Tax=Diabrotica virgifera virgifera TaxID=50390 RepID=A0A6P7G719_DIAVI
MDPITVQAATATEESDNTFATSEKETDTAFPENNSGDNSEYDSADADSYSEEDENVKVRSRASDLDEHSDDDSLILEREEGDGQESTPSKKVDDDEDKKNPQYIPKRGTFYEHDDRTLEENEEAIEEEAEKDKDGKKKIWQDQKERWSHDRFNEPEQQPKSRAELIAIYGYDIRNEEGPPRARRRRKYGRGPNKYTRNWEDEEAYTKPAPVRKEKKNLNRKSREEFPPLVRDTSETNEERYDLGITAKVDEESQFRKVETRNEPPVDRDRTYPPPRAENSLNNSSSQDNYNNKGNQSRVGSGRISGSVKEFNEAEYNGFTTKSRNARNRKSTPQKILPAKGRPKDDFIQSQNFYTSNKNNDLEKDMSKLNIDEGNGNKSSTGRSSFNNNANNQRQSSVPPRLQGEQKGSKRYSSIRQKSLPETNTPPLTNFQHPPTYYPNEYNQQSVPSPTQPIIHQNAAILSSTAQVAHVSALQPAALPQQVPVTAAPLLQAATFAPQAYAPPPPAFIQPGPVAGPPFIPGPPNPQLLNFVQSQPTFPPNFQGYQQPFNNVTPPTELYQPQGGITYYSADQQLAQQRQIHQKRPKAAIPIVAPPSYEKKEDNGNGHQQGGHAQIENDSVVEVQ